jgi:uncharacterized protein (DUF2267 family)
MSRTGVDSLDRSIDKTNTWLADVATSFGTEDRRLAYRVTRSWLHTLRDRLPAAIAAHIAAQLPELLRGVFYEGWNPSKVPIKYSRDEFVSRFARDAQIHVTEVPRVSRLVTTAMRRHISAGAIDEALGALPADIRALIEPADSQEEYAASPSAAPDGQVRPAGRIPAARHARSTASAMAGPVKAAGEAKSAGQTRTGGQR